MNSLDTFQTLDEALINAMLHTKRNPMDIVFIYSEGENEDFTNFLVNGYGIQVGSASVCNRPSILTDATDGIGEYLLSVEDCKLQAQKIRSYCAEKGIEEIDNGFSFVFLGIEDKISGNKIFVDLYLNQDCGMLRGAVATFNSRYSTPTSTLTLDEQSGKLYGTVSLLPEIGVFFARRKNKKINKEILKDFRDLVNTASSYLENR